MGKGTLLALVCAGGLVVGTALKSPRNVPEKEELTTLSCAPMVVTRGDSVAVLPGIQVHFPESTVVAYGVFDHWETYAVKIKKTGEERNELLVDSLESQLPSWVQQIPAHSVGDSVRQQFYGFWLDTCMDLIQKKQQKRIDDLLDPRYQN